MQIFDLTFLGAGYLLSTEPGQAEALQSALDMYLFAEYVTLADESPTYAPLELVGPKALEVLRQVATDAPSERGDEHEQALATFKDSPLRIVPLDVAGYPGLRVEVDPTHIEALFDALEVAGARPGGLVAHDSLRSDRVSGAFGSEITDDVYPQEARLEDAFSLEKGCYIGQEVVAKIDTYGGLNKRLFRLRVSHDDPVPAGTRLVRTIGDEQRDLGVVTTWAYSFEEDGGVVLGYVKRKHQEPGTEFQLGDSEATATLRA